MLKYSYEWVRHVVISEKQHSLPYSLGGQFHFIRHTHTKIHALKIEICLYTGLCKRKLNASTIRHTSNTFKRRVETKPFAQFEMPCYAQCD